MRCHEIRKKVTHTWYFEVTNPRQANILRVTINVRQWEYFSFFMDYSSFEYHAPLKKYRANVVYCNYNIY